MATYAEFLREKAQFGDGSGFEAHFIPAAMKPFQGHLARWSVRQGRGAVYAGCGLGKTFLELVFAQNVIEKTNKPALLLAPLGVTAQTVREGDKFGIGCVRSRDGKHSGKAEIVVTNYEQLHKFDPKDFGCVVGDESGCLKDADSKTTATVKEFLRTIPYRLLATATPAPNDYVELGTSSEALGYLGYMDMLARFFKNDQGSLNPMRNNGPRAKGVDFQATATKWRFKPHAETDFWRWVCSWSRSLRKPSDLGDFDDSEYDLPELVVRQTEVKASRPMPGFLFPLPAVGLREQRQERRSTIEERCRKAAELVADADSAICWADLNDEGDLLEEFVSDCVQVSGKDSDEAKEEKLDAFVRGQVRVLVTKPIIAAWGLNLQHCNRMTFFPSHSYERYYQGVRRCWRFGQKRKVYVDIVTTEGELDVLSNLQRKSDQADRMFEQVVACMANSLSIRSNDKFPVAPQVPSWL